MPEGHSVHRIARQFALHFVGKTVTATSPQGRFAAGAAQISGYRLLQAKAVGKQMFLEFDNQLWLRVHLGMYGAWDFAGAEHGSAQRRGSAADYESSLSSIGAPRVTRLRISEGETQLPGPAEGEAFPPEPIGAVRVRLLTDTTVADLRGPTACEVLRADEVQAVIDRLGPDPLVDSPKKGEQRFVDRVRTKPTPIGLLLMDQSVVAGIGNVYRAELLFRARLDPHTPGRLVPEETLRALYRDWAKLLTLGVQLGQMMTMDGLSPARRQAALASRDDRHWVYHRTGEPCRVCGTPIVMELAAGRKLYYCPVDQK
jgi:endonuclease VIII